MFYSAIKTTHVNTENQGFALDRLQKAGSSC
jgi:hypothetical protein